MKKILVMILSICLIAAVLGGCGTTEKVVEAMKFEDGGFAVGFPAKPELVQQTAKTPIGDIAFNMYIHEKKDVAYTVSYNDYPQEFIDSIEDMEMFYEGAIGGAAKSADATALEQKDITLGEYSGKEITYEGVLEGEDFSMFQRVFLVGNRLYQVNVTGTKKGIKMEDVQKFMDSFELINN
ncbi:MAG: hypothetical protein AB2421_17985 [Thermotaleaceae bacterium]